MCRFGIKALWIPANHAAAWLLNLGILSARAVLLLVHDSNVVYSRGALTAGPSGWQGKASGPLPTRLLKRGLSTPGKARLLDPCPQGSKRDNSLLAAPQVQG